MKTLNNAFFALIFVLIIPSLYGQTGNLVPYASGITNPVTIANSGDSRLFIVSRSGTIHIIDSAANVNPTPFLDISDRIISGGEQGLLGLAFHPLYPDSNYLYVNYIGVGDSSHISRFSADNSNPDVALENSEKVILSIEQPYTNHNGGDLSFGPDGYLYIGWGDGGSGGDPGNRSQNPELLLGKMLRIDVDHGDPYAIPPGNPFVGDPSTLDEIWALGLRNPWRYSFDRLTGDLWIADVGQNNYEEINFQPASDPGGLNYGWRCYEGNDIYNSSGCGPSSLYTFPVHVYSHSFGCSVTGGYVYRGSIFPGMYGRYFFADYCTDRIWTIKSEMGSWVVEDFGQFSNNNFTTFGENSGGELFVAGYGSDIIYRVVDSSASLQIEANVFLEGPFDGSQMITDLNANGNIPLSQPYFNDPWNYDGDESVIAIPNGDIVDWVIVELRDAKNVVSAADPSSRIARKAAFLMKDGSIVSLDGSSGLTFNNFINYQLFLVILHRNHLGVMSAFPLTGMNGIYSYDFTPGSDKAFGSEMGQAEIAAGIWGMFAGDSDGNGSINDFDKTTNWNMEAGMPGYMTADFELNNQVSNKDKNEYWIPNYLNTSQIEY